MKKVQLNELDPGKLIFGLGVIVAMFFAVIILVCSMLTSVPPGQTGVVSTFGKVELKPFEEGLHVKAPWQGVTLMDRRLRAFHAEATASSSDLQNVATQITVQYTLNNMFPETYQKMGDLERIECTTIGPAIQESLKSVTAKYTAEELITKRQEVKALVESQILNFIDTTFKDKGLNHVMTVSNVAITNFQFSDEFNKAIEAKVMAEQQALQARNEKVKKITEAEAEAAQVKLAAEAKAYAIHQESIMRAQAIKRESDALKENPKLVELRIAEKWNGQLPNVTSGMPLLNINPAGTNEKE